MMNATTTARPRFLVWADANPAKDTYHVVREFAATFRCGPPLVVSGRFRLTTDGPRYRIERDGDIHRIYRED